MAASLRITKDIVNRGLVSLDYRRLFEDRLRLVCDIDDESYVQGDGKGKYS